MSRRRYFEEQSSGNGAIYHCVKTEIEPGDRIRFFDLMNKIKSDTISQDKINYDGMRDLINNADEDVDCITSATESSIYYNDYFYIFV